MVGDETLSVAGIGCRRGCGGDTIAALVRRATRAAGCDVAALAAPAFRGEEPGVRSAARALALPLIVVERAALAAAQPRCVTRSGRAEQAVGFASVAEAAALAAAGPDSTLVLPRISGDGITCAIARGAK